MGIEISIVLCSLLQLLVEFLRLIKYMMYLCSTLHMRNVGREASKQFSALGDATTICKISILLAVPKKRSRDQLITWTKVMVYLINRHLRYPTSYGLYIIETWYLLLPSPNFTYLELRVDTTSTISIPSPKKGMYDARVAVAV